VGGSKFSVESIARKGIRVEDGVSALNFCDNKRHYFTMNFMK
jgi:hypothetical protein